MGQLTSPTLESEIEGKYISYMLQFLICRAIKLLWGPPGDNLLTLFLYYMRGSGGEGSWWMNTKLKQQFLRVLESVYK